MPQIARTLSANEIDALASYLSPYSDDLRERVVAAIEAGHSRVKVAELYNMALSTVGAHC
jgi:hypothetical protein